MRRAAALALVSVGDLTRERRFGLLSNPCKVPLMKPRRAMPQDQRPCQRQGCLNAATPRFDAHNRSHGRVIYLCHDCFVSLRVSQLQDLFLESAGKRT